MKIFSVEEKYNRISEEIESYCNLYNRDSDSVKLIVVTKSQPVEKIEQVITAGARYLGENYPEETIKKKTKLINSPNDLEWHMIGHLQSRKSRLVINQFAMFHSLDSVKLAKRLNDQLIDENKKIPALIQFNVGGEESKFGWNASEKNLWPVLLPDIEEVIKCSNLTIRGLMTMPPYTMDEKTSRKHFKDLYELGEFLNLNFPELQIKEYSMGTSHDFKMAIAEGATMIRIGTAIMGSRNEH